VVREGGRRFSLGRCFPGDDSRNISLILIPGTRRFLRFPACRLPVPGFISLDRKKSEEIMGNKTIERCIVFRNRAICRDIAAAETGP